MDLEVGDYVLVKSLGLGVITKLTDAQITIGFEKKKEKSFLYNHSEYNNFSHVPYEYIKIIEEKMQYRFFPLYVQRKAYEYSNLKVINNFSCENNIISADIQGTYKYKTSLIFSNNDITFSCTCPVKDSCKHEYALLNFLSAQISNTKSIFETKEIKTAIFKKLMKKPCTSKYWFDEIISCIRKISNEEIIKYINNKKTINENERMVLFFLKKKMSNNATFAQLISSSQNKSNVDLSFLTDDELEISLFYVYNSFIDNSYRIFYDTIEFLCSSVDNPKNILAFFSPLIDQFILDVKSNYNHATLSFLENTIEYDDSFFNKWVNKMVESKESFPTIMTFFPPLYKKLSNDIFYKFINNVFSNADDRLTNEFIRRADSYSKEDPIRFGIMLIKLQKALSKEQIEKLSSYNENINLIKMIINLNKVVFPNIKLTKEDFTDDYFIDFSNEKIYGYYYNEERYYQLVLKINILDYQAIIKKRIFLGNDVIIEYLLNEENLPDDGIPYVEELIKKIKEYDINSLGERIENAENEFNKIELEKRKKDLLDAFSSFSSSYENKEIQDYKKDCLYDLVPVFEMDNTKDRVISFILKLKLGNQKYYTLKSLSSFCKGFKYFEKIELGKKESFQCKYSNLNNRSQNLLKILENAFDIDNLKNQSSLKINVSTFDSIIELFKGENIVINKEDYYVSYKKIEFKASVDGKYHFHIEPNNASIFSLVNKYLLIHDNIIDYATLDYPVDTLRLFYRLSNKDLSHAKKEFIEDIYPLLSDSIEIDEKIKKEFEGTTIEIDSYFDYSDKCITLNIKYRLSDKTIKIEAIKDKNSLIKINNYNKIMTSLGFDSKSNKIEDEGDIFSFFKLDFSNLKKITNVYLSESIMNKQIDQFVSPKFKMTYNNDLMNCFYEKSSYSEDDLYQILKAIQHKKKFVLLKDDRIIDLENEDAKLFKSVVEEMDLNPKHLYTEEHEPLYKTLKIINYIDKKNIDEYILNMVNELSTFKETEYQLPKLNCNVRKYQEEGFKWLKILEKYSLGGILADDMGLGKSLEIISLLKSNSLNKPSLIVCPKSLIFNWINEFNKFDSETKVIKIYGNTEERKKFISSIDSNKKIIYVTSYDSLRIDIDNYSTEFNYVIIDEAQYIKNIEALKTRKVKELKATHKIALTGTPIENNLLDLWSIFDFIMPKYLDGITSFKSNCLSEEYINLVSKKIAPFILRRTKKDVLKDLPSKSERIVSYEMVPEQRKIYDAICLKAKKELEETGKAFNVLHLLTRLRQICVSPQLFVDKYEGTSGKIIGLTSLINDYIASNHRILIFSQFVQALELIETKLQEMNIEYFMLTGATKAEKRIHDMNEFNANEKIKVFLISLKAGGTGLNLIGADTIIHLDPWWNVSSENQASDRAYRIGQTKNVEVIKLIAEESIEERVIELQQIKKDLIDKVISDDDSSLTNLSKEDIQFLLQ